MVVEPYLDGRLPDIMLVPISISYERTFEEQLFARELLGIPKPKESTTVSHDQHGYSRLPIHAHTHTHSCRHTLTHTLTLTAQLAFVVHAGAFEGTIILDRGLWIHLYSHRFTRFSS